MKTLVLKENDVSIYLFDDETFIDMQSDKIIVGNPLQFIIGDCNIYNSILFENIEAPDDWKGWKYFFTEADGWVLNPDWVKPEPPPVEPTV